MSSVTPTPTFPSSFSFSFSRPQFASATFDPGATQGSGGGGGGGGGPSSSLYLYTFLVTLALLLAISTTIIVRSLLIRRRIRRAILNGTYIDPALGRGRGASGLGEKPKMWEVYLAANASEKGSTPLAGAVIHRDGSLSPSPNEDKPARPVPRPRFLVPFFHRRRTSPAPELTQHQSDIPPPAPSASSASSSIAKDHGEAEPEDDVETVQLALLIAMPTQPRRAAAAGCELELPPLELGIRTASARIRTPGLGA